MSLQLGLLRERLVRPMTAFPPTIIPVALRSIHRTGVLRDQVLLQSAGIRKERPADRFHPTAVQRPPAHVRLVVVGQRGRGARQNRRRTTIQRRGRLDRTGQEMRTVAAPGMPCIVGDAVMRVAVEMPVDRGLRLRARELLQAGIARVSDIAAEMLIPSLRARGSAVAYEARHLLEVAAIGLSLLDIVKTGGGSQHVRHVHVRQVRLAGVGRAPEPDVVFRKAMACLTVRRKVIGVTHWRREGKLCVGGLLVHGPLGQLCFGLTGLGILALVPRRGRQECGGVPRQGGIVGQEIGNALVDALGVAETVLVEADGPGAGTVDVVAVRLGADGGVVAVDEAIADGGAVQRAIVDLAAGVVDATTGAVLVTMAGPLIGGGSTRREHGHSRRQLIQGVPMAVQAEPAQLAQRHEQALWWERRVPSIFSMIRTIL